MTKNISKVKATPVKIGSYIVKKQLACSLYGVVLSAYHEITKQVVAIKYMKSITEDITQIMMMESVVMSRLNHPSIVPIYYSDIDPVVGQYIVMPYYQNATVFQLMSSMVINNDNKSLYNLRWIINVLQSLSHALIYSHKQGIVHGDMNPNNVYIGDNGHILLGDWGSSHTMTKSNKRYRRKVNMISGSPLCMSPMLKCGYCKSTLDDVYGLGLMIYYLIYSSYPKDILRDHYPFINTMSRVTLLTSIPEKLLVIMRRAISENENDRYPSIQDLLNDLESMNVVDDAPFQSRNPMKSFTTKI